MKVCFQKKGVIRTSIVFLGICLLNLITFNVAPCLAQTIDNPGRECNKELAKTMVHGTALGLGNVLIDLKNEEKRIDLIRTFIRPIRFYSDNSGYFYVYDFSCVNIAHATQKELQGNNLYDYKDVKGKFVIRELSAAAKNGGGFVEFYWVKPGSGGEQKKLGYVEPVPGTNYFIGTGVYLP